MAWDKRWSETGSYRVVYKFIGYNYQNVENEKIISQIIGISKVCDGSGD